MKPIVFLSLVSIGCGPSFDHLEYAPIGSVPSGALFEPTLVSVPAGASVAARVVAVDSDGARMNCEPALVSGNPSIMRVQRSDRGETVFSGVAVGEAAISVACPDDSGLVTGRVTSAPAN